MPPDPVTLMVARRVTRGRYRDFTAWLEEGRELACDFAGYLGSGVLVATLALTPVMVFVFIPLSMRLLGPWLRGEVSPLARLGRCLHQRRA